ncbi:MAG TPA: bifunctional hydroxymethylpyrimidine kinase/phosphomethylpyrimidine kinase [Thermoanaerobaculia bacterium]|jgi:hydroxymethylpyrimidine/phosphomethylpyrimidine kinase|nr:bifunctional hydroxymethylpyrimidine kinase/phosphomethylpyrimidine kinase [Thermoanaerobaculia bacterium]
MENSGRPVARRPATAVSIAASDSGGGAGIQADLLTFAAHGVHGATVLTAGTAQDSRRIRAIEPFPPRFVRAQIDAVFADFRPRAVKIGALVDAGIVRAVAAGLARHGARHVVLDPVTLAKGGRRLLSRQAALALRRDLLPLCELVTPNLPEAESLAGVRIRSDGDRRLAAGILADLGAGAVLLKGGHARGRSVRDLLFDGRFFVEFVAPRMPGPPVHGTGCTLSAAIAANLALGRSLEHAVERAIRFLRDAIRRPLRPGSGPPVPDRRTRRPPQKR